MQKTKTLNGTAQFSAQVTAKPMRLGLGFEADQFSESAFPNKSMSPFVMVDHFRMYEPTFQVHPHAGISAVTLMLEDSTAGMWAIDSTGEQCEVLKGDLHWTVAGTGIVHNQTPLTGDGDVVHALQIFVNLPQQLKAIPPRSFNVPSSDMPRHILGGASVKVMAGSYLGLQSPAPVPQELFMLDIECKAGADDVQVPLPAAWNALILPISGLFFADNDALLGLGRAITAKAPAHADTTLTLSFPEGGHAVVLAGPNDDSSVVTNGPFVYANEQDLREASKRYSRGEFGVC